MDMGDLFEDSEYYRLSKKEAKQRFDKMYSIIKASATSLLK